MLQKLRNRTSIKFLRQCGEEAPPERMVENERNGAVNHAPGSLEGDYDRIGTEPARSAFMLCGRR